MTLVTAHIRATRVQISERQAGGIRAAKQRGVYQGRARKLTDFQLPEVWHLIETGVPKAEVARRFGVDCTTSYRAIARHDGGDGNEARITATT